VALVAATLGFYLWTLGTSVPRWPPIAGREPDYFNLLAHGFLKGRLSLDAPVPDALKNSENPYDPAKRPAAGVLHDATYYKGKYYIYYGAAPVVTLLVPFILITGRDLPLAYGVLFFCIGGYLLSVALFLRVRRRCFPGAGGVATLACLLALGWATTVPLLLRRHAFYECSIASGFFFLMGSLYCLMRCPSSSRAPAWALGAGLALGFAIASRPTYAAAAGLVLAPLLFRRGAAGRRQVFAAVAGCGAVTAGIMAYNFARFGSPLEFGTSYILSGIVEAKAKYFSAGYVPFNAYAYFVAPLELGRYFPFFHGASLGVLPAGYGFADNPFGLFPNLPFAVFSLVAMGAVFARVLPRALSDPSMGSFAERRCAFAVAGYAAVSPAAFLCLFYSSAARYMGDFSPAFALAACLGLLELESRAPVGAARLGVRVLGLAAAVFSTTVAVLVSLQLYGMFRQFAPRAYAVVGRALNAPAAVLERAVAQPYGPLEIEIGPGRDAGSGLEPLLATGWRPETDALFAERLGNARMRIAFRHGEGGPVFYSAPFLLDERQPHRFRFEMGSLYPPETHPFFERLSEGETNHLKGWVRVDVDGRRIWEMRAECYEASPGALSIGESGSSQNDFLGRRVLSVRRGAIVVSADRAWIPGPATVEFSLHASMVGRSFPLVTTGRTGYGDALCLRVLSETSVQFVYDFWGKPPAASPAFTLEQGRLHRIEFSVPSMLAEGDSDSVEVGLDGARVWRQNVIHHPSTRFQVFLGRNAIGASSCEPIFEEADFER
jgi:hypothetical protein